MYVKTKDLLVEILEDEGAILFEEKSEKIYILNSIGYYIWNNIEGNSINNLATEIKKIICNKDEYTIDDINQYVEEYINSLIDNNLVALSF